jgi:ketosteroid isomerase-like protein
MSEQANVRVVQEAYAAFNRGDVPAILSSLSETVEWIAPGVEPVAGTYRGRDGAAQFFQKVKETVEFSAFEPREYVAQGDRVIALGNYKARAHTTGKSYDCDWVMSFTFRGGKVTKFQEFTDTAAIAEALTSTSAARA